MGRRRGDTHRVLRWLWTSRRVDARLTRLVLLPASGLWQAGMAARRAVYRRGWLTVRDLPLPSVAIGNLTVGGSGKNAIAAWVAAHYARRGIVPGIVLASGSSTDVRVMEHAVEGARVTTGNDVFEAAGRAAAAGAAVLVLDDAYQRLDVRSDLTIAVVSAETTRAVGWTVPAGPWREGRPALDRADVIIITRKRASTEAAAQLQAELQAGSARPVAIASLALRYLEGLVSGARHPAGLLAGRRVVAATASVDPDAFVAQTKATGAAVQVATWRDQEDFRDEDVAWLAHATRRADHVVITERDAAKLRDRWPARVAEPLVAVLDLEWESGGDAVVAALAAVVTPVERL